MFQLLVIAARVFETFRVTCYLLLKALKPKGPIEARPSKTIRFGIKPGFIFSGD